MTFKQRLPYFLGGLTIGIIIVVFVFEKKNTTFDYGPNARVLKNIRLKERVFSEKALAILNTYEIDTAKISQVLKKGDVDLRNKIKLDSCLYTYTIQGKQELKNITLTVTNCESMAIIEDIKIE
ncbi:MULTISPECIES: DUF4258 domain-containing protein [Flavobacteriaceae]|uniref:DUF4258 domain-containing protein n=2 Tax=Flavobacteriaceae TaxID=49546 RepID=A0A4Y8AX45_9FLAO|nr:MULTISPECIES: DUF4258 domain-containing protein [Flavobacteriaceae]TEW76604.1 DUF4258 domain-containing protein [Gramella jeungdoensis]GGK51573.1 hypothetical protein GCM10007963_19960 [Lutibacter litoralis]